MKPKRIPLRKPVRRRMPIALAMAAVVVLAAIAGAFWLRGRGGSGLGRLPGGLSPSRLNLVVVTLDTTRADRLGCYGSRDVETPHLDRLAAGGVLFENAISPAPLTLPVHSSLFTGLFPGAHGVRDNGGFKLAPERHTLAEVLQENGWATGGFVSAYVLDHRWGIAQGFDRYLDDFDLSKYKSVSMGDIQRRGDDTVARGLDWIREVTGKGGKDGRPFFAWIHLYDPHAPYEPPEPFASRYPQRPYNGEIAWTDSLVGRLLDGLEQMGLTERTVVAVIGDHGESLGEHHETGHGFFIYEPTVRVPFLLAGPYPGLSGRRVPGVVRHVDLMPTVLALLGVETKLRMQGESLLPLILGEPDAPELPGYSEAYYSRFHYGWSELRAIRTERWHFIEAPRPELYDLAADPGERRNLAAEERRTVATLRQVLAKLEAEIGTLPAAAAPLEEDEETLRKLAALGYLGAHTDASGKSWRELPDPKDRIRVYNLMDRARDELLGGDADRTIATLREVLAEDPEVIDAWFMLGNAWLQKRDWKRAADYFRKTLEKRPDHDYAMIGLADTLVARGQVADAVLGYERFLKGDPDNAQITYRLAQVLLDDGRSDEAERYFRNTLKIEPKTARAEVGLAVVAFRRQDLAGSRKAIERALAIDPAAGHARYNLALIREAEGDLPGAAEAYRAEIADRPTAYKAHFNLGRLLARQGDTAGASAALRRAVEENPDFAIGRFFYAQSLVAAGDFAGAAEQARRGLVLDAGSRYAALGHYVLADVYNRLGRRAEAAEEVRKGRLAESR